mmetsp:Transcript_812/g.1834  ORF Transcript_812/g.1834 Transcript_812/m.1834 type:complete len:100 (+) Transcript_812:319-618(+)
MSVTSIEREDSWLRYILYDQVFPLLPYGLEEVTRTTMMFRDNKLQSLLSGGETRLSYFCGPPFKDRMGCEVYERTGNLSPPSSIAMSFPFVVVQTRLDW